MWFLHIVRGLAAGLLRFFNRRGVAWVLGVAVPPIMLLLDPVVFRGSFVGPGLLSGYRAAGYVGIASGVVALALLLVRGSAKAFVAGFMVGAALFGLALGVTILPFSLIGILFFGVGLLGLSPFLSAAVFGVWAQRTFREADPRLRTLQAAAGLLVFGGLCIGAQVGATHVLRTSIGDIVSGGVRKQRSAEGRLSRWQWLVDMDQLMLAWEKQSDPEAKQRLADAYKGVTGQDIEERASQLAD